MIYNLHSYLGKINKSGIEKIRHGKLKSRHDDTSFYFGFFLNNIFCCFHFVYFRICFRLDSTETRPYET